MNSLAIKTKSPIIRLKSAHKAWCAGNRRIEILRGIDLNIYTGESLAIMGPSGAGKSTLLHVIGLLTPLDEGEILFDGQPLSTAILCRNHRLRQNIGFVFQDAKLINSLNVLENVCLPLNHRGIWPARQKKMAHRELCDVGLEERMLHKPHQLSGGELLRVAIARALVLQPRILLSDEPTGTLDSETGEKISELLWKTVTPQRALIIVTHHKPLARRADRVIFMKDGNFDISSQ